MKTTAGLWIDHRKAVIVILLPAGEETIEIESGLNRPSKATDSLGREFDGHLAKYYDEVIEVIREAQSVLIFGPGEAKGELKSRLEEAKLGGIVFAVETEDKMTDGQISAKIHAFFHE